MSGWLRYDRHLPSPNRHRRSAAHARSASPLSRRLRLEALEDRRLLTLALPGDYNVDTNVDAADYVVWRKTLGATGVPPFTRADGDGDTTIDQDDYTVWRANFSVRATPNVGLSVGIISHRLQRSSPPVSKTHAFDGISLACQKLISAIGLTLDDRTPQETPHQPKVKRHKLEPVLKQNRQSGSRSYP